MNSFEEKFFKKYIPEWQEMRWIIHQHWVRIIGQLFFWMIWWVLLPSFIYYFSVRLKELVPFYFLEWFLILVFIKIIYDVFDWYNDVWIITDDWVIDLDWKLFKTVTTSVNYENIEWIEVDQNWIWDKILRKWDIIIHKIWDDAFELTDCVNPYHAVDEIEQISTEKAEYEDDNKFDMVMETLSWVVEDYLERKWLQKSESTKSWYESIKEKEVIDNAKNKKWTIDLR